MVWGSQGCHYQYGCVSGSQRRVDRLANQSTLLHCCTSLHGATIQKHSRLRPQSLVHSRTHSFTHTHWNTRSIFLSHTHTLTVSLAQTLSHAHLFAQIHDHLFTLTIITQTHARSLKLSLTQTYKIATVSWVRHCSTPQNSCAGNQRPTATDLGIWTRTKKSQRLEH
jgi:hypothetical protein